MKYEPGLTALLPVLAGPLGCQGLAACSSWSAVEDSPVLLGRCCRALEFPSPVCTPVSCLEVPRYSCRWSPSLGFSPALQSKSLAGWWRPACVPGGALASLSRSWTRFCHSWVEQAWPWHSLVGWLEMLMC